MKKKLVTKSKSYYQKKADRLLQELGKEVYKSCLVCGKPNQVLHHYFPKSSSNNLRYFWQNLIPLCNGCHFSLHQKSNPDIQNKINEIKGANWLQDLKIEKNKFIKSNTISYYKNMVEILTLCLSKKTTKGLGS